MGDDEPRDGLTDRDGLVDEASQESFPASDSPGYPSRSIGGRAADARPRGHRFRDPEKERRAQRQTPG